MNAKTKVNRGIKLKKFLFPLYPIKVSSSTKTLVILAVLIALRIVLSLFSVSIPSITETISFAWVPLMVIGWYFGPVIGFFLGWVTDTLCYLLFTSGLWFWMYSIQEPCICLIAGIFGGIYRIRSTCKSNIIYDILIQQIIYISFSSVCYISLIMWLTPDVTKFTDTTALVYKYLALGLITLFLIIMETLTFCQISINKNRLNHLLLFIYTSCLVVILMEIFSFLLGPISTVEYYKYLHNGNFPGDERFLKYGAIIYLIPRVIVQCIKTPLECMVFMGIVWAINPSFNYVITSVNNKWK